MRKLIAFAPLCAFTLLMPGVARAQTTGTIDDAGIQQDDAIVVSANRAPVRIDQVGQSITVLNQAAIEASQAIGVTELIAQTPGVQFTRNGGPGTSTSIFIRGAETGQTVILYDGVRLQDPSTTDGGASLADMMTGDIGRIEVLRGAQSTLYGSQAIGGVINLISRVPTRPLEVDLQIEGGGLDSYLAKGGLGGRQDGLTWRVGGGYTTTDGISAFAGGTEDDGYENVTLHGRLNYAFNDAVDLDLRSFYSSGTVDFDTPSADALNVGETDSWLNYVGLNIALFGRLRNRLAYTRTDISRINYDYSPAREPQPVTFDAAGKADRFEYQGTLDITQGWLAVFGVEYAENDMRTASPSVANPNPSPIRASDHTTGFYGQLQAEVLEGLSLTGGVRQEEHSTFGGSTVGSASVAYTPNDGETVFRASWAEGFKAPSLYQLYSMYGNTDLAPEQAASWDAGFEHTLFETVSISAVYFSRTSENLIAYIGCTAEPDNPLCADGRQGFYDNVGRVEVEGVEVGASIDLGGFTASANYTYLDAKNQTAGTANQGRRLARRAQNTVNTTASYIWPFGLVTAASVRIVGPSFNDAANNQRLDGFIVTDIRLSYPINESVEVYARVENVFDEDYEMITNYGTMPRVFYAGARLRL